MGNYCNSCDQCQWRKGEKSEFRFENDINASRLLGYNSEFLKKINDNLPKIIKLQSIARMLIAKNLLHELKKHKMNIICQSPNEKDSEINSNRNLHNNSNSLKELEIYQNDTKKQIIFNNDENENEIEESKSKKLSQHLENSNENERGKKICNSKVENKDQEEQVDLTFKTGIKYKGGLKKGLRNGFGIQIWPEGTKYEGNWINDEIGGIGKLSISNGDIYEGGFNDGNLNGIGQYFHENGVYYRGYWKDNKKEGEGMEKWPDGSSFQGQFHNGLRHGKGKFISKEGVVYEGDWSEGTIIKDNNSFLGKKEAKGQDTQNDNFLEGKEIPLIDRNKNNSIGPKVYKLGSELCKVSNNDKNEDLNE